ncbi:MAG TPA: hypothetical protein VFA10_28745 [Ktedonobacteraceae bacterium]|nr:hypothetical protein [Ktedonobacteraceae bacterium]
MGLIGIGLAGASSTSKARYYTSFDATGVTLAESRAWDELVLRQMISRGLLDPMTIRSCLLAGCASPRSLRAMEELIGWLCPWRSAQQPIQLLIVDREPQALARLEPLGSTPGICRHLLLADLCHLPDGLPACQFMRADYVQNFLAPGQQSQLLRSLGQGLAPGGVLASTITLVARPALVDASHWRRGQQTQWGCRLWEDEDTGICTVDLSLPCLEQAAQTAGLAFADAAWSAEEEEDETHAELGWRRYEQHYLVYWNKGGSE